MEDESFHQKTRDFLTWFKSQPGTTFHNDIEIQDLRQQGAGRGIIATADIPADTVLFTIPRDTILSKETSPLTTLLPQLLTTPAPTLTAKDKADEDHSMNGSPEPDDDDDDDDDETAQDAWTTLILVLIHAHLQGPASQWAPYLAILPQTPADFNTPMFWTPAEKAELQASPMVARIGLAEAETMIHTKILPVIAAHPDVFAPPAGSAPLTPDDFAALAFRIGSTIMAYAFDLEPSSSPSPSPSPPSSSDPNAADGWIEDPHPAAAPSPLGMVPMADILNADASFNTHIQHSATDLTATTLQPIPAGAHILNYYGPLGTSELLRRYGYITPAHARWDLVDLSWALHVLPALRAELGGAVSGVEWDRAVFSLPSDDEEYEDGFVLEYAAADPDEFGRVEAVRAPADVPEDLVTRMKEVLARVKSVRPDAVPSKTARDQVIYGAVGRAVEKRAREYGTTLEEDEEALAREGDGWGQRKRMAVTVRIGEKKILREVAQSVKRRLAVLSLAERDGDGRSAKRRKVA